MTCTKPVPRVDEDSAAFWHGLTNERIVLQECGNCGRVRFPPGPRCPWCASAEFRTVDVSGEGRIYSWITIHRALDPAFADEVPYTIAVIDMDDGCRMLGRIVEAHQVGIGARVRPNFRHHADWSELRFAVVSDS